MLRRHWIFIAAFTICAMSLASWGAVHRTDFPPLHGLAKGLGVEPTSEVEPEDPEVLASQAPLLPKSKSTALLMKETLREDIALAPQWHNGDYLRHVEKPDEGKSFNDMIFDTSLTREISERYRGANDIYEMKQPYQQSIYSREKDAMDRDARNRDVADWTMRRIFQYHFDRVVNEPPKQSKALQAVSKGVKTVQSIQNQAVTFTPETKLRLKVDIPQSAARLSFVSPYVESSAEYQMRSFSILGPAGRDGFYLSANRSIRPIGASTYVRYAVLDDVYTYGASKHLVGPVSAHVDRNNNMRNPAADETVYRLSLGLEFPH